MPRDHPRQRGQWGKKKKNQATKWSIKLATNFFSLSPTTLFFLSPRLSTCISEEFGQLKKKVCSWFRFHFSFSFFELFLSPIFYFISFRFSFSFFRFFVFHILLRFFVFRFLFYHFRFSFLSFVFPFLFFVFSFFIFRFIFRFSICFHFRSFHFRFCFDFLFLFLLRRSSTKDPTDFSCNGLN